MHASNRPRRSSRLAACARVTLAIVAGLTTAHAARAQTSIPAALSGTFTTSSTLATGTGLTLDLGLAVNYIIVGGGGGGGGGANGLGFGGGGGGGGGNVSTGVFAVSPQAYALTVGGGGAGGLGSGAATAQSGTAGGSSSIFGLTALGGGGGGPGSNTGSQTTLAGDGGGSGRTASGTFTATTGGGNNFDGAGGGAGAGANGSNGTDISNAGGIGGAGGGGVTSSITSGTYGGGGGGGGSWDGSGSSQSDGGGGAGGSGGGGAGAQLPGTVAASGVNGLGGGGGGGGYTNGSASTAGGSGGSGVVIVAYETQGSTIATGGTVTTSGSNTIHSFASGGTSGTTSSITFSFDTSRLSGETSGVISGTGALTYAGAGTLTLSAANTYSGGTIVNSGSLIARGGLANATSNTVTANAGGTFIFGAADVFTNHTGTVQPTIVVNEGGTVRNASGVFNPLGAVTLNGGTLDSAGFSSASGVGFALKGTVAVTGSTTSTISGSGIGLGAAAVASTTFNVADGAAATDLLVSGVLRDGPGPTWPNSQTSSLVKTGAGTMVLTGTNTYSGETTVKAGTLLVSGSNTGGGVYSLGAANGDNGTLQMTGGGISASSLFVGRTGNARGTVAQTDGTITITGGADAVRIGGGDGAGDAAAVGEYTISGGSLAVTNNLQVGAYGTGTLTQSGGSVSSGGWLAIGRFAGSNGTYTISGGTLSQTNPARRLFVGEAGTATLNVSGSAAVNLTGGMNFLGGTGTVNLDGGTVTTPLIEDGGGVSVLNFNGGVLKTSTSTTTFLQGLNNAFIKAGGATIDTNGYDITISQALLTDATSTGGSLTKIGAGTLTFGGSNTYTGGTTISAGRLVGTTASLPGAITNNAAVEFAQATTGTYAGTMTGSGSFTKTGAGTLTLSGTNSYGGGTTVSAGRLVGTTDSLQGAITNNAAVEFAQAVNGAYTGNMGGSGSLTKSGNGTLTLGGANSYSGGTTVSAGRLVGTTASLQGAITNNSEVEFAQASTGSYSGAMSGTGSLTKTGAGTVTLSGTNSYSGGTTVSAGRLVGTTASLQGAITNNAAVEFSQATSGTYAGSMTGSGSFTKTGAGTVTLSGTNSYGGGTTVSAGRLIGNTASLQGAITNDAAVEFAQAVTGTYAGTMGGSGSFTKSGAGNLTLTGTNSYSGGTTLSAGKLIGTTASLQGAIANGSIVVFDQATAGTFAGSVSGVGAIEKSGVGTVVLGAANSHSGGTTVNAGTLAVTANGALGTPGVTEGVIFGTGVGANPASGTARDANWTMVAVPSTWTPPSSVPYAAYVPRTVSAAMVGGNTSSVQNGYTADGTTVYWISPQSTVTGLVSGTYNWIVAQQFNVVRDGNYSFTFGGAGDNEISFFVGGTIDTSNPVTPVITGGQQIGTTWNSFTTIGTLSGTASLTAGTHTAYMVLRDTGGDTGALITQSSFTPPAGTIVNAGSTLDLRNVAYTTSDLITLNGATLATSTGSSSWAGTVSLASASTVDVTGDALGIQGAISGAGSLTKSGVGNLILSGSSSYSGATTVAAGRLSVNGMLGNTPIAVLAAAELGGSGSIAGPVSVASGGTLSPGNSIASLVAGATSFATGATFEYEVDSSLLGSLATAADLLVVSGNLDIASGSLLTFTDITSGTVQPFVEDTTIFAMINYTGSWNNGLFTYGGNELADGERFFVGSQQWEIDYNYAYNTASPSTIRPLNFQADYLPSSGTQTFVAITAVPEPSTLVLLGIGSALACWAARRRRALPRTPHGVALPAQA